MSDLSELPGMSPQQAVPGNSAVGDAGESGFVSIEEVPEKADATAEPSPTVVKPTIPLSEQARERAGTVEHLAARRSLPAIESNDPAIKERLGTLRSELTGLLTSLRWEDLTVEDAAQRLMPLLNVGPVQQWKPVLIPFMYEIDRGGVLIPVWRVIIERDDPPVAADANPAETPLGRARRFAILMLGNYRTFGIARPAGSAANETDITRYLGSLATDPNTSLYATQALVKHATVPAMQALIGALKEARGWAKVDVVEGCLALKQERFYDLLLARGLDDVAGLESYVAIPLYRAIPLGEYLRGERGDPTLGPLATQNAALVLHQVLLESMTPPTGAEQPLPVAFERDLPLQAQALFAGARSRPTWHNVLALHRLGLFLGRYWQEISLSTIKDVRIVEPIYRCVPLMNEIEPWMAGPGRDTLLQDLTSESVERVTPIVRMLGDWREQRALPGLSSILERTNNLQDRVQALALGAVCETIGLLGDRRALAPLAQFLNRTIDRAQRAQKQKRRDNLPPGDPDIPGSIVYAAILRAYGRLEDRLVLGDALQAVNDLDPYVRLQALDAIKRLDPLGEDARTRQVVRAALLDPHEAVIRKACQFILQYHDQEAVASLQRLREIRPELAQLAQDILAQLGY